MDCLPLRWVVEQPLSSWRYDTAVAVSDLIRSNCCLSDYGILRLRRGAWISPSLLRAGDYTPRSALFQCRRRLAAAQSPAPFAVHPTAAVWDWLHWVGSGQPEQAMYQAILTSWFDELEPADWWRRDSALDELIRQRFGQTHRQAAAGELWGWRASAEGRLAEVIVLDQFSRNL